MVPLIIWLLGRPRGPPSLPISPRPHQQHSLMSVHPYALASSSFVLTLALSHMSHLRMMQPSMPPCCFASLLRLWRRRELQRWSLRIMLIRTFRQHIKRFFVPLQVQALALGSCRPNTRPITWPILTSCSPLRCAFASPCSLLTPFADMGNVGRLVCV